MRFRPKRTGLQSPLGELEENLMEQLWSLEEASTGEVQQRIALRREIAYTTVITTLNRLFDKGLLLRRRQGKVYLYKPRYSRSELESRIVREALGELLDRFPDAVAAFFAGGCDAEGRRQLEALRHRLAPPNPGDRDRE